MVLCWHVFDKWGSWFFNFVFFLLFALFCYIYYKSSLVCSILHIQHPIFFLLFIVWPTFLYSWYSNIRFFLFSFNDGFQGVSVNSVFFNYASHFSIFIINCAQYLINFICSTLLLFILYCFTFFSLSVIL